MDEKNTNYAYEVSNETHPRKNDLGRGFLYIGHR
jgi:hypothetical protein